MSFANFDYEAQTPLPSRASAQSSSSSSSHDLDKIICKTSTQLQLFSQLITQLDTQRKQLGTRRDCQQLRENIDVGVEKVMELSGGVLRLMNDLNVVINKNSGSGAGIGISNRQIVIKERLMGEYNELDRKFRKTVRIYNDKRRVTPLRQSQLQETKINELTPLLLDKNENGRGRQQQEQIQEQEENINKTELQYHILLTQERNREIEQVTEGILEVNSIFKDLNQLVQEQGAQLNTIEDNVLQLHGNTQQADRELQKAHEYQKSRGKWGCILLVALCIVVLIIVLAVVS